MPPPRALAAVALAALAACGSQASAPPAAAPSDWLDVQGMRCGDGTPTGIAISRGRSDAVLVYLAPGGACWSATACNADVKRFGRGEYELARIFHVERGSVLDRTLAGNPFAEWTHVFIPYCTGDVHAGDSVQPYGGPAGTWEHNGWRNIEAAVSALTVNLPLPAELVVAGSSAGGFGALAAYALVRDTWDPSGAISAALLDDSGPTFVGTAIPEALLSAWWDAWGLDSTVGTRCPACAPRSRTGGQSDLSELWTVLAGDPRHARDRFGLLSTIHDATMRDFFADPALAISSQKALEFQSNLDALAAKLATLGPNVASFRVGGADAFRHPLLAGSQPTFLDSPEGPALLSWLSAMVLDPTWSSTTVTSP